MFANSFKEIDPSELDQWLNDASQDMRVLDVRGMDEIATGTVPKAIALPLHTLPIKAHDFSKQQKLVVLCHSGGRSAQACMYLQQQGFTNVYNLRGGMMGWRQSGFAAHRLG